MERVVSPAMGAVTGELFPRQIAAENVSTGTSIETLGEPQRELAAIITAGILTRS